MGEQVALTECRDCGHQVSKRATKCPSCGARLRKPQRGVFGQLFKWLFIGFNALMVWILAVGINSVRNAPPADTQGVLTQDAANAAAAVGSGIGFSMIVVAWLVGVVILGIPTLLTRARD
jgi:hypothetical protein